YYNSGSARLTRSPANLSACRDAKVCSLPRLETISLCSYQRIKAGSPNAAACLKSLTGSVKNWLLNPPVDAVRRHALGGATVHGHDTPLPVLALGNGRTKTGRIWVYVRDDRPSGSPEAPAVWLAYTTERRGEHLQRQLANFKGVVQADAFARHAELYAAHAVPLSFGN
ncbi:hypothetical protein F4827_007084, partial [Paraburkholderia bannensis]|nr:hypothetical protein [Paraburkholderia sp. WP4_3_2]MBB6107202.1 hypothetical protein [Paraburkholderia bannensis]